MTKIFVKDLEKDLALALTEFIVASIPKGEVDNHGATIDVTGLSNKKLKFLLHKFLHTKDSTTTESSTQPASSKLSTSNQKRRRSICTRT